ncbi:hypothetical protein BU25DRAFT_345137 [Macroventuria anomochaeta]|uniref:Uncharacterized protein n=1 Tax=Macroventuria anomochaeta TaxID=301207 RepID=A0ACB6RUF9_9PLEO|nr:uncharacterized protein BU25DRAFT_345137 [Macroventuria anomochaeta]KAF2625640.1 hypothetical protein BU25DRAFT_345137 [Macroventuria anomochaeta]
MSGWVLDAESDYFLPVAREIQQRCRNRIVKRTPTRHGLEVGLRPVPTRELSELP